MAVKDFRSIEAWRDPRDGAIYVRRIKGPGVDYRFQGTLPVGDRPGTLPRLEDVAGELVADGFKEINRRAGVNNAIALSFQRMAYDNPWEQFDAERQAQNTPSDATEGPTTGDPADSGTDDLTGPQNPPEGSADMRDQLRGFNTSIHF